MPLTTEQRIAAQRVRAHDGPIKIHYASENCYACGQPRPMPEKPWYIYVRYNYAAEVFGRPFITLLHFRTFREACDKVREIFSEGSK